jgi:hypothetical protein
MGAAVVTAAQIASTLRGHRYLYDDELDLQDSLDDVLTGAGHHVAREVSLSARDRIDLLVGTVGIEVKIAGTADALCRQLTRYAHHDEIRELVAVVGRANLTDLPEAVAGVPVTVVYLETF